MQMLKRNLLLFAYMTGQFIDHTGLRISVSGRFGEASNSTQRNLLYVPVVSLGHAIGTFG